MIQNMQDFTESLPPALQFLGIMLAAFIPYVEGEGAAIVGAIVGINPWIAIPVAMLSNIAIVTVIVLAFEKIRAAVIRRRAKKGKTKPLLTKSQEKVRKATEKYGVPGVSLLGPFLLPTHLTAAALVSLGSDKGYVILWQAIAITLYTVGLGALFYWFIEATAGMA